jgi:hypothetical protein
VIRLWPHKRQALKAREDLERARLAESIADAIDIHADVIRAEHLAIQRENHLGPRIHRALGGH